MDSSQRLFQQAFSVFAVTICAGFLNSEESEEFLSRPPLCNKNSSRVPTVLIPAAAIIYDLGITVFLRR
jgi:hypothetical protein